MTSSVVTDADRKTTAEIVNQLTLIRKVCRGLLGTPAASELANVVNALDRMIADLGPAMNICAAAAAKFAALRGSSGNVGDYDEEGRLASARMRRVPATSTAGMRELLAALTIEDACWQACEDAVQNEVAGSRACAAAGIDSKEPLNMQALARFINCAIDGENRVEVVQARVASDGFSKKTLFVSLRGNRVLPDEIVLRMDKPFNYIGTTVRDEYPALRLLHAHGAPVPYPYAIESNGEVLGGPFLLMTRFRGSNVGKSYFPPAHSERLSAGIARALAQIHAVPVPQTRIGAPRADARPYIEFEVDKYRNLWNSMPFVRPIVEAGLLWIEANMATAHGALTLVHNDFNYHNLIIDGDQVSGVVDWEFVHVGNPAADIGYFQDSADRAGGLEKFLEHYERAGGKRPSMPELDFYTVWAHLRLCIMLYDAENCYLSGKFDDLSYAGPGVHLIRRPLLAAGRQLSLILARKLESLGD